MLRNLLFFASFVLCAQAQSADRGKEVYKLCAQCHMEDGSGKPSIGAPNISGMPEWYVERQLENFRHGKRGYHPKDVAGLRMRPMGRAIPKDSDIKEVAAVVAKLPVIKNKATVDGNAENGKALFATCMACHGANAEGNKILNAPKLAGQDDWYLYTQLMNFRNGLRGADPELDPIGYSMQANAKMLANEQAVKDVVTFIQTLK